MFRFVPSASSRMTLAEVVDRLARNERVSGVLVIGSTRRDALTPASDYDLIVVLSENPLSLHVGVTYIDHRLTDLIFLRGEQIEQVLALDAPVDGDAWLGRIVRWLQDGRIVWDRTGRLAQAQRKVRHGDWLVPLDVADAYGPWFRVNYNLVQTGRMLRSEDPVYLVAADVRMALYGPLDLLFGYFAIRGLRWEGDKWAIRYLMAHDPEYLELLRVFIAEPDRGRKFRLYEELAARTVAPVGELWSGEVSVMEFEGRVGLEIVEAASGFWDELIGAGDQPSAG
ncbi:MAG: hypothetical protein GXP39_17500 [Chloroflexi bacterium]|nr:hypothetical protein [Chloroflexota bacterium]